MLRGSVVKLAPTWLRLSSVGHSAGAWSNILFFKGAAISRLAWPERPRRRPQPPACATPRPSPPIRAPKLITFAWDTQVYIFLIYLTPTNWIPAPEELFFSTPTKKDKTALPDIKTDPTTLALSVIVPAYNETTRLEKMLDEAVDYLETVDLSTPAGEDSLLPKGVVAGSYEILVVDDGSTDDTTAFALKVAAKLAKKYKSPRGTTKVVELLQNRGKGGATKFGVLRASGYRVLWADADGASKFSCLAQLQAELDGMERAQKAAALGSVVADAAVSPKGEYIDLGDEKRAELLRSVTEGWQGGYGLVVGSRAHLVGTEQVAKVSSPYLMRGAA